MITIAIECQLKMPQRLTTEHITAQFIEHLPLFTERIAIKNSAAIGPSFKTNRAVAVYLPSSHAL